MLDESAEYCVLLLASDELTCVTSYIYIHFQLLLVHYVDLTLGSANFDSRSIEVDSELNIAKTCRS